MKENFTLKVVIPPIKYMILNQSEDSQIRV